MLPDSHPRGNCQSRTGRVERHSAPSDLAEGSSEFERRWFELDRSAVIGQLSALRRAIANGAMQMEMIAAERIFEEPLSEEIRQKTFALKRFARQLKELEVKVTSASGYPKPNKG
jgi:hypothetical protein